MDVNRAKEILSSKDTIEVLYQGSPVWIENVRENNIASISHLNKTHMQEDVPVYKLVENNPVH